MEIYLNEATADRRTIPVYLTDATDGFTPETGVTSPTIYVSKNGGTATVGGGTWAEISAANMPGWYYYRATAAEVDTEGVLILRIVKTGTSREWPGRAQIIDPTKRQNSQASIQTAMTAQGYTTGRAPNLDYLNQGLIAMEDNIRGSDDRDLTEIAGSGFATGTHSLVAIRAALSAAASDSELARKYCTNKMEWDFTGADAVVILYDDDDATPLKSHVQKTNSNGKPTLVPTVQTKRAASSI
jgi:hypothetical protein